MGEVEERGKRQGMQGGSLPPAAPNHLTALEGANIMTQAELKIATAAAEKATADQGRDWELGAHKPEIYIAALTAAVTALQEGADPEAAVQEASGAAWGYMLEHMAPEGSRYLPLEALIGQGTGVERMEKGTRITA